MPYSNSRTLIIGAAGFLGKNLVRYFDERGWPYVTLTRAVVDLCNRSATGRAFRSLPPTDRIFHLATHQRTGKALRQFPVENIQSNARLHLNVLEAWSKYQSQAKLITTGSSCAYPDSDKPLPESLFGQGGMHETVRDYGLTKQLLAYGCEAYAAELGLCYLHCVLATMYGPYNHSDQNRLHFVDGMVRRAIAEKAAPAAHFSVWGSGDTVRECLFVTDQIEAILAADAAFENMVLNCAANDPVTVDEVARTILEVLNWEARIEYPSGTFQGTSKKVLDSSRFLEATGWRPRFTLREGLESLADFLQNSSTGRERRE